MMNEQQLTQVTDAMEEATAFQPGGSKQLAPRQPTPADSLRDAAKELMEITTNMVDLVNRTADDVEKHLRKVKRFTDVVAETWRKEIDPD
jgi:hypothetical protein